MRILVLGGDGMLGHKMFQVMAERHDTYASFIDRNGPWRTYPMYAGLGPDRLFGGVDVTNLTEVVRLVATVKPDVIINAVGIIKQLRESNDALISLELNSMLPHRLAELADAAGARLFHFSTDCVFTGNKVEPYVESDPSDAEDLYGRSKLLGEINRPNSMTIRTSIFGRDFLTKAQPAMLEWFLSNEGGKVRGFTNHMFTGFPTLIIARIVRDIIENHPDLYGLYHVTADPINKNDLLTLIRDKMSCKIEIEPFETDPPVYRDMDSSRFRTVANYTIPSWDEMIDELAADPTPYEQWKAENE